MSTVPCLIFIFVCQMSLCQDVPLVLFLLLATFYFHYWSELASLLFWWSFRPRPLSQDQRQCGCIPHNTALVLVLSSFPPRFLSPFRILVAVCTYSILLVHHFLILHF